MGNADKPGDSQEMTPIGRKELIMADYPGFQDQAPEFADIVREVYLQHPVSFPGNWSKAPGSHL
ncbi:MULTISPECIES: hypothetical protein [Nitrosomonas]|uniref:hypothetical protein n=1 Tax=Nitrosomonas TaxID=914 RepID=UPI0023F13D99|nr:MULTISPECIES: hypothetical protein [Nitrosomonas]